jgi:DNA-binding NarL/FixJ family response regulator
MSPVRVLTVDDQPVFLEAARALIASTPGFTLAGEACSGLEAIDAAARLEPDMVLLDVRMPGLDGIETARRLSSAHPLTVVVLVSGHDVADVETLAEASGAVALVVKERLRPRLLRELWAGHGAAGRHSAPVSREEQGLP